MYWAGLTYDEARRQCLDARHRGMDAITRKDVDPRTEFNAVWDYVRETTTDAMPPAPPSNVKLTPLQTAMRQKLAGARFPAYAAPHEIYPFAYGRHLPHH